VSSAEGVDPGGAPLGKARGPTSEETSAPGGRDPPGGVRGGGGRSEGTSEPEGPREEGTTSSGGVCRRGEPESEGKLSSVEGEPTPVVKESLTAAQGPAKRKVPMRCQVVCHEMRCLLERDLAAHRQTG